MDIQKTNINHSGCLSGCMGKCKESAVKFCFDDKTIVESTQDKNYINKQMLQLIEAFPVYMQQQTRNKELIARSTSINLKQQKTADMETINDKSHQIANTKVIK